MPGVGKDYEPRIELLKGVALITNHVDPVSVSDEKKLNDFYNDYTTTTTTTTNTTTSKDDDESELNYLKYFPRDLLPYNVEKRFEMLFKEQEKWRVEDLKVYLQPLVDDFGFVMSDLLSQYCRKGDDSLYYSIVKC